MAATAHHTRQTLPVGQYKDCLGTQTRSNRSSEWTAPLAITQGLPSKVAATG